MRGRQYVLILAIPLDLCCSLWLESQGKSGLTPRGAPRTIKCGQSYKRIQGTIRIEPQLDPPNTGLFVRRMSQPHNQPSMPVLTT